MNMKKTREPQTPIQSALSKIKAAYIMAFLSAGITLIAVIMSMAGKPILGINIFALLDVALIIVLAVLLIKLKSRIASVILFLYYIASQVLMRIDNPGVGSAFTIVFALMYFYGILGTFSYQKIKKQANAEQIEGTVEL